jgi:predicted metal-dependent peptidase
MKLEDFPKLNIKPNMKVLIGLDFSSSIHNDSKKIYRYYLSQLTSQLCTTNSKVKVFSFDTELSTEKNYDFNNILDLVDYNYHALNVCNGGSSLEKLYQYDKESNFNADYIIVMTDGLLDFKTTYNLDKSIFVIVDTEPAYNIFNQLENLGIKIVKAELL